MNAIAETSIAKFANAHTGVAMEPKLKTITTIDQMESLQSDWDQLTIEPLQSFAWHFAWWKNFQHLGQLNLFVLEVKGRVVGIAPLYIDRWGGQKRLRFIGSGTTCTDYATLIVAEQWHDRFVKEITSEVAASTAMLELEGVSGNEPHDSFMEQFGDRFWRYDIELEPTWILELPEEWTEFIAGSKKSLRRKIKKAEKRLASDEFEIRSTLDELPLEEGWDLLVKLHQSRFEGKGEPGAFKDEHFTNFLHDAVVALNEDDRVEIIVAFHEGEPMGAHLILLGPAGPRLYQAGIEMTKSKFEPGHLLITYAVRRAIERGHNVFDFLRGTEPYKPYWGAIPSQIKCIRFVSRSAIPTVLNRGFCLLRQFKHKVASPKKQK
jgi:CelD/BcsL family acetyltransferase involved in cellulose biosynthesis